MKTEADIIVIGAGIAGTSAAAALSGAASVLILEQEEQPGYHSTGRSAATWAPFYGPPIIQQLTALSKPTLSTPDESMGGVAFTSPRGEMMLGRPGDDAEIERNKAFGMEQLTLAEAQHYVPLVREDNVTAVLYTDNMLSIDVDALHQAYIKKCKAAGGSIVCNAKVSSLDYQDNLWHVNTANATFKAPVIINAAGAWADQVAALAGARQAGLQPKRRSAALIPYAEHANMHEWPMIFGAGENFYCTPFGNGMMVSPADETLVEPHDAWPEDIDLAEAIDNFQQVINYDVPKIEHSWAGLRTFAPDGEPVAGFDPAIEGFYWLAGQGGYGIQTSPAMAIVCASQVQRYRQDKGLEHSIRVKDTPTFTAIDNKEVDTIARQLSPTRF